MGLFISLHGVAFGAQVKITAGYGGELGYQAPLWVAHELKLFAKHGMTSELVRIAGGARSTAALLANALQVSQSAGVAPVQANLAGGDLVIIATSTNRPTVSIVGQPKTVKKPQDLIGKTVGLVGPGEMNILFSQRAGTLGHRSEVGHGPGYSRNSAAARRSGRRHHRCDGAAAAV